MMRWAVALGWLLVAGAAAAGGPMDLNSPFPKTALILSHSGEMEERQILRARVVDGSIEMTTTHGSTALFPAEEVVAILPRLPTGQEEFEPGDLDRALALLQGLPSSLQSRPEASPETLQKWRDLRKPAEEAQAQRRLDEKAKAEQKKSQEEAKVRKWFREATDLNKARNEAELAQIKAQGKQLLVTEIGSSSMVPDGLAFLSQIVGKENGGPLPELPKIQSVQTVLLPAEALTWFAAGVVFISFIGLLLGLSFSLSSLTRFREGKLLSGLVFGGAGAGILLGLAWIWWPMRGEGDPWSSAVSPKMESIILFSKNSVKPVYYFPRMEFQISAEEFTSGILGSLPPAEEATGIFKGKLKPGSLWVGQGRFFWKQPMAVLGVPLPVSFNFEGPIPSPRSWREIHADKVSLGRIELPTPVSEFLSEEMKTIFRNGLQAVGLFGVQVQPEAGGLLVVTTPASGARPAVATDAKSASAYRRQITAEELAQAFVKGQGQEFKGKFIEVEGAVSKVSSGSEFSGVQSAGQGGVLDKKKAVQIHGDAFDVFYLEGMKSHGPRNDPLFIKLIIKSPEIFVMDAYGDIYKGPNANIVKEKPLIKKGYRVKFLREGRVQRDRIQNNEIEVYGVEINTPDDILTFDPNLPASVGN